MFLLESNSCTVVLAASAICFACTVISTGVSLRNCAPSIAASTSVLVNPVGVAVRSMGTPILLLLQVRWNSPMRLRPPEPKSLGVGRKVATPSPCSWVDIATRIFYRSLVNACTSRAPSLSAGALLSVSTLIVILCSMPFSKEMKTPRSISGAYGYWTFNLGSFNHCKPCRECYISSHCCRGSEKNGSGILCQKPVLQAVSPPLCPTHFQQTQKQAARSLRKAGIMLPLGYFPKSAPKLHHFVAEYVRVIQSKRRTALRNTHGRGETSATNGETTYGVSGISNQAGALILSRNTIHKREAEEHPAERNGQRTDEASGKPILVWMCSRAFVLYISRFLYLNFVKTKLKLFYASKCASSNPMCSW